MAEDNKSRAFRYFAEIEGWSKHPGSRALYYLFIPVFFFGLLGLIWMIPFPEIGLLKKYGYHIFLNWASIYIAIVIYYYLRLIPLLSYMVLLSIGVMSYLIVQLEYQEMAGGPAVWLVCLVLMLISLFSLWIGTRIEKNSPSGRQFLSFLLHGPVWLWHLIFKKLNVRH